jgi:mRNA interferase HigB
VRIIAQTTLKAYWEKHPSTKAPLRIWTATTRTASWDSPLAVTRTFASAKALNGERVRFEIGSHRLIVAFNFYAQIAFVKFIGTHAEYDRIDALTISLY